MSKKVSKKSWRVINDCFFLEDNSSKIASLAYGIYDLQFDTNKGLFLRKIDNGFDFPFKVYGLEADLIRRVKKTWDNTNGNLGILLNGRKGTGKTVTGEIIAEQLKIPVILIGHNYGGLQSFLAEIDQDVTIFIDEYDKVFSGNIDEEEWDADNNKGTSTTLLSLMDGVYKTSYRKMFILTTNRKWVNENMLGRPGRIRYVKEFNDLESDQVQEIMDDMLKKPEWRKPIVDFLKPLDLITVDVVKSVVTEVNLFDEDPKVCCKNMNLQFKDDTFQLTRKKGKEIVVLEKNLRLQDIMPLLENGEDYLGGPYRLGRKNYVIEKISDDKPGEFDISVYGSRTKSIFTVNLEKESYIHSAMTF